MKTAIPTRLFGCSQPSLHSLYVEQPLKGVTCVVCWLCHADEAKQGRNSCPWLVIDRVILVTRASDRAGIFCRLQVEIYRDCYMNKANLRPKNVSLGLIRPKVSYSCNSHGKFQPATCKKYLPLGSTQG